MYLPQDKPWHKCHIAAWHAGAESGSECLAWLGEAGTNLNHINGKAGFLNELFLEKEEGREPERERSIRVASHACPDRIKSTACW